MCDLVCCPDNNLNSVAAAKTVTEMVIRMPQLTSVEHGMQQWLAVVCAWEVVEQSPQRTLPSTLPDVRTMTQLDLSRKKECERGQRERESAREDWFYVRLSYCVSYENSKVRVAK